MAFKIAGIKQKTSLKGTDTNAVLSKVRVALNERPDLLVLPEYALNAGSPETNNYTLAVKALLEMSKKFPETLIIGGTYIAFEGSTVNNRVPIIKAGQLIGLYDKKRTSDLELAKFGKNFSPKYDSYAFSHNGKTIGLEVCLDYCDPDRPGVLKSRGQRFSIHCVPMWDGEMSSGNTVAPIYVLNTGEYNGKALVISNATLIKDTNKFSLFLID